MSEIGSKFSFLIIYANNNKDADGNYNFASAEQDEMLKRENWTVPFKGKGHKVDFCYNVGMDKSYANKLIDNLVVAYEEHIQKSIRKGLQNIRRVLGPLLETNEKQGLQGMISESSVDCHSAFGEAEGIRSALPPQNAKDIKGLMRALRAKANLSILLTGGSEKGEGSKFKGLKGLVSQQIRQATSELSTAIFELSQQFKVENSFPGTTLAHCGWYISDLKSWSSKCQQVLDSQDGEEKKSFIHDHTAVTAELVKFVSKCPDPVQDEKKMFEWMRRNAAQLSKRQKEVERLQDKLDAKRAGKSEGTDDELSGLNGSDEIDNAHKKGQSAIQDALTCVMTYTCLSLLRNNAITTDATLRKSLKDVHDALLHRELSCPDPIMDEMEAIVGKPQKSDAQATATPKATAGTGRGHHGKESGTAKPAANPATVPRTVASVPPTRRVSTKTTAIVVDDDNVDAAPRTGAPKPKRARQDGAAAIVAATRAPGGAKRGRGAISEAVPAEPAQPTKSKLTRSKRTGGKH